MLLSLCHITQPLHQVIGYSDILELTTLSEVQLDSVKLIQRSTESLMAIINDLLDFSAYEENGVKVSNIGFSLRGLLKGCLAAVEPGASMKQLTLNLDIPSNVPKVVIGDPHKLRQVLLSLLQNAVKFNRSGGTVSFRVCPTAMLDQTQWLRFEVQDTGIGIDEKHQGLIFEKYQQVDMNNTRSFDGKGLGLAICKSVSEAMGGKIYLESNLGEGSSFFVELPFKLPLEQTRCTSAQPFRLMALDEPLQVLVVDDNEVSATSRFPLRKFRILLIACLPYDAGQQKDGTAHGRKDGSYHNDCRKWTSSNRHYQGERN